VTRALPALALALAAAACAGGAPRGLHEPVPESVELTIADSVRYLVDAAATAIGDEGVSVRAADKSDGFVESEWIDIGALKTFEDRSTYTPPMRTVKFVFHLRPTFGGTVVSGAAVYRPTPYGGRNSERMVPADHAGREVLARIMRNLREHADEARRKREERRGSGRDAA
jgi:hypothetical protein